jgi:hypothetical protein
MIQLTRRLEQLARDTTIDQDAAYSAIGFSSRPVLLCRLANQHPRSLTPVQRQTVPMVAFHAKPTVVCPEARPFCFRVKASASCGECFGC